MVRLRRILVHALIISAISLSVCLASCNGNGSTTIPKTTVVLDETTLNCLSGASENFSTLSFENTTEQLSSLSVGDVIVSGVGNITPYGLLREVTNVVVNGDQVVVETAPAALEDAIQDCTIDTNWRLQSDGTFVPLETLEMAAENMLSTESGNALASSLEPLATGFHFHLDDVVLHDDDGYPNTKDDQVTADVSVDMNIDFNIGWTIRGFKLIEAHSQATVNVIATVELLCKVAAKEIHRSVPLYRQYLPAFTVWIGPVPVPILPVLDINVGLNGEVSVGIGGRVTEDDSLTVGVQYNEGNWSPVADYSASFDWSVPTLSAGCEVKAYLGPRLSFLLYGGGGPYMEARAYLELDADVFRTPWWELYAGLEADVGFRVEAMGHKIADYEKPLAIGYRQLLAQAEITEPVTLTISSTAGGLVTAPGEGTFTRDEGIVVNLVAEAEEGYRFVNWTGDVGTIANVNAPSTTITMNDSYSITANFEAIPPGQYDLTTSVVPSGVGSVSPSSGSYSAGTQVTITASPASGYRFVNWTGDVGTIANVNAPSTTITMNDSYSITANFEAIPPGQYTLTTSVIPSGGGSISPSSGSYSAGTQVTITASPASGYRFVHWGGAAASGWTETQCQQNPVTITMDGSKSISANFENLTITVASPNGGESWDVGSTHAITWSVTGNTANINYFTIVYSTDGGSTWPSIGAGTVAASARSYSWTIPNTPSTQCLVRVRAIDAEIWILDYDISNANFVIRQPTTTKYSLTTSVIPSGGGSISLNPSGGSYDAGTVVTLTASPNSASGYRFVHWGGAAASGWTETQCQQNPVTITMDANKSISANFENLTITVASPNGGESWDVGSTHTITWSVTGNTANISYFTIVYSTDGGSTWNSIGAGAVAASARSYSWTIPNAPSTQCRVRVRAIDAETWILEYDTSNANFTIKTATIYTLTTSVIPSGGGSISPSSGSYSAGTQVTLTASPASGYRFVHWGGAAASGWTEAQCQQNPVTITMDANKSISANFENLTITVTSPNGGESWYVGSTHTITWSVTGNTANISYFTIVYSTDGGSTWNSIGAGAVAASARSYSWTIPNAPYTQCRVRVRAIDAETWILDYDISNANFTIR